MTLLEVVFATATLAMIVSVLFGAIGFMLGRQRVEQQTLGAAEVANRLMLQYLDDFTSMPDPSLPIAYGKERYRWEQLPNRSIRIEPAEPARRSRAGTPDRVGSLLEKSDLVTIKVWLGEESGGSLTPTTAVPHASVTRIVYPLLASRNPDSWENAQKNDEVIRTLRDKLSGGGPGANVGTFGGKAGAPRGNSGKPGSTPRRGGQGGGNGGGP